MDPPTTCVPGVDAELGGERPLDCDLVLHGDDREAGPVRASVRSPRARPCGALAAPEHVRADDEVAVGVDRRPGPDDRTPPSRARMSGLDRTAHVRVTAQGVQDEHRVGGSGIELTPGLVGDRHLVEAAAGFKVQTVAVASRAREQRHEAPPTRVVPRPPGRSDRGEAQRRVQLRRPSPT